MAYGFGTTVNPQLGAVDYSNYLRGALTGAQMQAQGTGAIGQGIQNALGSIGQGINQYAENKKKLKAQEGSIKSFSNLLNSARAVELKRNRPQAEVVTYLDDALSKLNDSSLSTDERFAFTTKAVEGLSSIIQLGAQSAKEQEAKNAAEFGNALRFYGGNLPGMFDTGRFTPEERAAGTNQYLNQRNLEAEATARLTPKTDKPSFQQQSVIAEVRAFEDKEGRPPTPSETAAIYANVQQRSRGGIEINTGEKYLDQETSKATVKRNQGLLSDAEIGQATMRKTIELKNLLENGDVNTGVFANIMQAKDRFIAGFGGEEAIKSASQTELAQAFMGSEVFQLFQQLGVGAKGLDTPPERDFMMKVLTGDITMQKQAILGLAKRRYDEGRRAIEKYNRTFGKSERYRSWVDEYTMGDAPVYEVIDWSDSRSDSGLPPEPSDRVRTFNPQTRKLE